MIDIAYEKLRKTNKNLLFHVIQCFRVFIEKYHSEFYRRRHSQTKGELYLKRKSEMKIIN